MRSKIPLIAGALCLSALCTVTGVSAFFTDRVSLVGKISVKDNFSGDNYVVLSDFNEDEAKGILPGDTINFSPKLINPFRENALGFLEITVPAIVSDGVKKPVFSYEVLPGWSPVKTIEKEEEQTRVYSYDEAILPRKETEPVFNKIDFLRLSGNESLLGRDITVGFRAYLAKEAAITEKNLKSKEEMADAIKADEKEEFSKRSLKEASVSVGEFKVKIRSEEDGGERQVVVENVGDGKAVVFLKIRSLRKPTIKDGVDDLVLLGTEGDEYIYGLSTPLSEGESTDNLLDKLDIEGFIGARVVAIQADNLMVDGEKVSTDEPLTEDMLRRIYELLRGGGFFVSEDERENIEILFGGPGILVEEVFDNSKKLSVGENLYEKRVSLKSIVSYPQFVRIKLDFSEEEIKDKILFSRDGKEFLSLNELKANPGDKWEYVNKDDEEYFLYKRILEKNEETLPLFSYVKINFESEKDIRDFDIFVTGEGRGEEY